MIFAYSISEPSRGILATCGWRGYDACQRRWRAIGFTDAKLARAAATRVAAALIREYALDRLCGDIMAIEWCPVGNFDPRVWTRSGEDTTPHPGNVWSDWNPKQRDWLFSCRRTPAACLPGPVSPSLQWPNLVRLSVRIWRARQAGSKQPTRKALSYRPEGTLTTAWHASCASTSSRQSQNESEDAGSRGVTPDWLCGRLHQWENPSGLRP